MRNWVRLIYLFAVAAASYPAAAAHPPPTMKRTLTLKQAASLVEIAVRHQLKAVHPRGPFSLETIAVENNKRFRSFEALGVWDSSRAGSAVIGNYSVNMTTAQVWDDTSCEEMRFPQLDALKRRYIPRVNLKAGKRGVNAPPRSCL